MVLDRAWWHHGFVESPASSPPRRILLVDDCADLRTLMRILLEFEGHIVHEATNGPAAIDAVMDNTFDIAFVDVGLPGVNGYEVARRIRGVAPGRSVSLVALTGFGTEEDRRRAFEAGFDEHLIKPTDHEKIAALVSRPPRRATETA
ncbi:MAG TPA: response regulator [Burkholderiales bacterium]|jgi:CheY-like chemotaxis protein|nr:response regulator [Burkholderiales bacterium]